MYSLGQVYIGKSVPLVVKVTTGVAVFPRAVVTDPSGVITLVDLNVWVDENGGVIDPTVYTGLYLVAAEGSHILEIKIYSDPIYTLDVTATRLVGYNVGNFIGIFNPLDELVSLHQGEGTLGKYLQDLLSYITLFEYSGDGSCPVSLNIKNGEGVAFQVISLDGVTTYARGVLDTFGRATVYLDKGTYRVEFYPPCGKTMEKSYEIIVVDCPSGNVTPTC